MPPVETPVREDVEETPGAPADDGLGPVDDDIPGGAQPGDDGYDGPDPDDAPPADEEPEAQGQEPPTPPADLPDDGTGEEGEGPSDQLFVLGDKELGLKVGGRKPDSAVLKFKGGKVDLSGQFDLEQRLLTVDTWQITGDDNQHTIEKHTGTVKVSSKAQSATLCATKRIEDYLAERLREGLSGEELARVFDLLDLEVPEA